MAAPALRMAWLLRAVAWCAVFAAILGVLVVPGMHGTFPSNVVERFDSISLVLSYAMGVLLVLATVLGGWDLSRLKEIPIVGRIAAVASGLVVVGLFLPACATRLPPIGSAMLVIAASSTAVIGGIVGSRAPHTRAASIALAVFASAALVHLLAWHVANLGGSRASTGLWNFGRGISTAAVVLEAAGQMIAAAWLGTRQHPKLGTKVAMASNFVAMLGAFLVVLFASRATETSPPWQLMLHASLGDAGVSPPPFGLGAVATFLAVAALTLGAAVSAQPVAVGAVTASLTLALIAHGQLDAPLRALAAVTASVWLMVASTDQRAMWRSMRTPAQK